MQPGIDSHRHARPAKAGHRRSRMIRGKLESPRALPPVPYARSQAGGPTGYLHLPRRLRDHVATTCSRRTGRAARRKPAPRRDSAPHTLTPGPGSAGPATSRRRQCGAAPTATRAAGARCGKSHARSGNSRLSSIPVAAAATMRSASASSVTSSTTRIGRASTAGKIS